MEVAALDPEAQFVEDLGLISEADGLPRIAGKIFGLLIVEEGPFCFEELAERLQISRASVSTNTRLLESRGMIERFTVPGERRDFFRLGQDDPYGRMLERALQRLRKVRQIVDHCRQSLPEASVGRQRLDRMSRFYRMAISSTEETLDRWRDEEQDHR